MSKREMLRERRHREQQRRRLFLIGGIAVIVIILAAILIIPNVLASSQPVGSIVAITPAAYPQANGLSMGDPNAPVKVVEYSDYQCPYCGEFARNSEAQFVSKYVATGKVYFTYSPFSFVDDAPGATGQESKRSAQASYCANDQGQFWAYHDMLFANQNGENQGNFRDQRLIAFAEKLNLNMSQFKSCLSGGTYQQQVVKDNTTAEQAGITSTPSFVVNGKLVDMNALDQAVDDALAGKK